MEDMVDAARNTELISIIIPAYNEALNMDELEARLSRVLGTIPQFDFEIILIDNCSLDDTYRRACAVAERDPRWRCIRFSRNFGAEASLNAGLHQAQGNAVIILFSDLQEPPELIPAMLSKWQEGYDVVYGTLEGRADDRWYKRLGARIAYRIIHWLSDVKIPTDATDFRLLSRRCVEALKQCGETSRYMRGLVHWVGFQQTSIKYKRDPRKHGKSTTDLRFLMQYFISAATSFSAKPLEIVSIFGLIATATSILGGLLYITLHVLAYSRVISLNPPPVGWTTQTIAIFFFGGINCFFLGVTGKYISKIYDEAKRRPLWIIADRFPDSSSTTPR